VTQPKKSHNHLSRARKIVEELVNAGHTAYFAGGYVRDYLLGMASEEIDIATSASPEVVQKLFPKTVAVGAAFGVIVVICEEGSFEVATFRNDGAYVDGRHPEGVHFSTPKEDAQRRDFTINGMFFDPLRDLILDYVGGQEDLNKKVIRAIGNPHKRFEEDRLRMLRAVRFSHRFSFSIDSETENAIQEHASTLFPSVSVERVWQELTKMAQQGNFAQALQKLDQLFLLRVIFPELQSFTIPLWMTSHRIPLPAFLLPLFPHLSIEEIVGICERMKTSGDEIKLVEYLFKVKKAQERADWAPLYADKRFSIVFEMSSEDEKMVHEKRMEDLKFFIQRIKDKDPLVTSRDLSALGIQPGPKMGTLLKEAERLSINENIRNKQELIQRLL
jgi:poly(A) polymerase